MRFKLSNMRQANYLCLLLILILNSLVIAQELDKKTKRVGLSAQILGPTSLGLYLDYQLTSRLFLDTALGIESDFQIGFTYTFSERKKRIFWYPYIGAQITSVKRSNDSFERQGADRTMTLYLPFGLKFVSKNEMVFAFEAGYNFVQEDFKQGNTQNWLAAIRIGMFF